MGIMILCVAMSACLSAQIVDGEQIYHILPKDAISAIMEPEIVGIDQGDVFMAVDEQILAQA